MPLYTPTLQLPAQIENSWLAQSPMDTAALSVGTATVAAIVYCTKVPWPQGGTIANIDYYIGTAGGTITNGYLGVYSSAGTLLGQSADLSATWNASTTWQAAPVAATVAAAVNGFFWVGLYEGSVVTGVTLQGGAAATGITNGPTAAQALTAGRNVQFTTSAGLSVLPNLTLGSLVASTIKQFFVGVR